MQRETLRVKAKKKKKIKIKTMNLPIEENQKMLQ